MPDRDFIVATKYWHALADGRIQCDVCPRACKLHEGQAGLCFVRANMNGRIVLTTYGRSYFLNTRLTSPRRAVNTT